MLRIEGGELVDLGEYQRPKKQPKVKPAYANCGGAKTRARVPWSREEYEYLVKWWYVLGIVRVAVDLNRETQEVERVGKKLGLIDPEALIDRHYRRLSK